MENFMPGANPLEGLLGPKPMDPTVMGLLSAAAAGMQASGPSRTPTSIGQTFGAALGAGMPAYMQTQQFNAQRQMQGLQTAKLLDDMAQTGQQRNAIRDYAMSLPETERPQFLANPQGYLAAKAKAMEPFSLKPGEQRYNGNGVVAQAPEAFTLSPGQVRISGGNVAAAVPERPRTAADATGVLRYLDGDQTGAVVPGFGTMKSPEGFTRNPDGSLKIDPGFLAGKSQIAAAGASRINNTTTIKQEGKEAETVGKFYGDQFANMQTAGFNANSTINKLNRLESLLTGINTGKLTPAGTEVAALADSLGFKIDKNLPAKQAAAALTNEIALEMRNPSGGAGMPGAMSDKDREFLQAMTPSLANTPQGNKLLIDTRKKLAQRDKDVARLATEYRKKNGQMDGGFQAVLEDFANKNPLFPTNAAQGVVAPNASSPAKFLGFE